MTSPTHTTAYIVKDTLDSKERWVRVPEGTTIGNIEDFLGKKVHSAKGSFRYRIKYFCDLNNDDVGKIFQFSDGDTAQFLGWSEDDEFVEFADSYWYIFKLTESDFDRLQPIVIKE